MLRLRGFDAGIKHDFNNLNETSNPGVFDGVIDTWACDTSEGFFGQGKSIGGAYKDYHLPQNQDDCWQTVYPLGISLSEWKLGIYPIAQTEFSRKDKNMQINPYIKMTLKNKLYTPYWATPNAAFAQTFVMPVEAIFNIKSFYHK